MVPLEVFVGDIAGTVMCDISCYIILGHIAFSKLDWSNFNHYILIKSVRRIANYNASKKRTMTSSLSKTIGVNMASYISPAV